jgi:hypothetical protein
MASVFYNASLTGMLTSLAAINKRKKAGAQSQSDINPGNISDVAFFVVFILFIAFWIGAASVVVSMWRSIPFWFGILLLFVLIFVPCGPILIIGLYPFYPKRRRDIFTYQGFAYSPFSYEPVGFGGNRKYDGAIVEI